MNDAYIKNNAKIPLNLTGFMKLDFTHNDDVDEYVKQEDYIGKELCFALGWNKFDP